MSHLARGPARRARCYQVVHETTYRYGSPVALSRQDLHLTPRQTEWQVLHDHEIAVAPSPAKLHARLDYWGNPVRHFALEVPHDTLVVRATSRVEVRSRGVNRDTTSSPWEEVAAGLRYGAQPVDLEANAFRFESPYVRVKAALADYAAPCFSPRRPLVDAAWALMHRIHDEFEYDPDATRVGTPVLDLLADKRGVCQDFAHLMIGCLRSLGLAARYVSGYLLTEPPPGQPRLVGADASHAWVAVRCPGVPGGWVDFDPTNDLLPDTEHVTLGWGRDFGDVSPLRGVILGGDSAPPDVAVTVLPISGPEDPPAADPAPPAAPTLALPPASAPAAFASSATRDH